MVRYHVPEYPDNQSQAGCQRVTIGDDVGAWEYLTGAKVGGLVMPEASLDPLAVPLPLPIIEKEHRGKASDNKGEKTNERWYVVWGNDITIDEISMGLKVDLWTR